MRRCIALGSAGLGLLVSMLVLAQGQQKWQYPEPREPKSKGSVMAPSYDDYYFYTPESDRVPEEFLAHRNLRGLTQSQLKGYHIPPVLHKVEIHNRQVKAGDTVRFTALYDDPAGEVIFLSASYQGPKGRRTNLQGRFRPSAKNPLRLEGELKLSPWAEPGRYFALEMHAGNRLGHSKGYFSDFHQELSDIWFEVADNPNMDVTPPVLTEFVLFDGKEGMPKIKIGDTIPIRAKVADERSGPKEVRVFIISPSGKYAEAQLMSSMSEKNVFIGAVQLNPFYEAGEYRVHRVWIEDEAGNERYYFFSSDEMVAKARVFVEKNDKADGTAAKLINVSFDRENAGFNEDVKVEAIVTDDLSGVEHVTVFVQSPSILDKRRVQLRPKAKPPVIINPKFDLNQNIYEGTFKVDPMDEPGVWTVSRVVATDFANNHLNILSTELPALASVGVAINAGGAAPSATTTSGQPAAAQSATPGKIRRIDMIPPHPIRGACINCHEP